MQVLYTIAKALYIGGLTQALLYIGSDSAIAKIRIIILYYYNNKPVFCYFYSLHFPERPWP